MIDRSQPLLVFGPTASGKSAYALARARDTPSIILNADSMQVYCDLAILTARPGSVELSAVPHALYGHVDAGQAHSVGQWLREMSVALVDVRARGLRPIIVGGTGLYFKALTEGLAEVPDIAPDVRQFWRAEAERLGADELWQVLATRDPLMAERLARSDVQRICRALEVIDSTGRSLGDWQQQTTAPLLPLSATAPVRLDRGDADLKARVRARLQAMFEDDGLAEVAALRQRGLSPDLPLMRAVGLTEASAFLRGDLARTVAIDAAAAITWQYIRRQRTWARKHMMSWKALNL